MYKIDRKGGGVQKSNNRKLLIFLRHVDFRYFYIKIPNMD